MILCIHSAKCKYIKERRLIMIISSQGFGHFVKGINNQDFGIESSRAILILDGCSGAPYAGVGTTVT